MAHKQVAQLLKNENVESEIIIRYGMINYGNLVCKRFECIEVLLNCLIFLLNQSELLFESHSFGARLASIYRESV